jgi:hypothetical protein
VAGWQGGRVAGWQGCRAVFFLETGPLTVCDMLSSMGYPILTWDDVKWDNHTEMG